MQEKEKRKSVPKWEIANFWKDKCITSDGEVMIEIGYEGCNEEEWRSIDSEPVICDWGEVECFACRTYFHSCDEGDSFKRIWNAGNTKHLQICHITPFAMTKDDSLENLFLMCSRCHKESPDCKDKKWFFKWVYNRRKQGNGLLREFNEAKLILERDYDIKNPLINIKDALDGSKINSHGGSISNSTFVATFVQNAIENEKRVNDLKSQIITEGVI